MAIFLDINIRIEKIYEEFKKDAEDKTGWSLMQKLRKESGQDNRLKGFLLYQLYKISYEQNETIPLLLQDFIGYVMSSKDPDEKEVVRVGSKLDLKNAVEIFPGIACRRDLLINLLEKLKLDKTLKTYCTFSLMKEEELRHSNYFSESQMKKFNGPDKEAVDFVLDVFNKECKEKGIILKKRIIKLKSLEST